MLVHVTVQLIHALLILRIIGPSQTYYGTTEPWLLVGNSSESNKCLYKIFNCYKCLKVALLSVTHNFESNSTQYMGFTPRINLAKRGVWRVSQVPKCLWKHQELGAFKREGLAA